MSSNGDVLPRILVVDDDSDVRESLVDELAESYDVTAVESGEAALCELSDQKYDAIVSDVRMPGLGGVELVRKAQALDPDMVRILLTGYSDDAALEAAWMPDGVYKLGKPWGVELEIVLRRGLEHQHRLREAKQRIDLERGARERAELAISRLDKMASLGTLAAGVAHEMRAPLTYLRANFEWFRTGIEEAKDWFGLMEIAARGAGDEKSKIALSRLSELREGCGGISPIEELENVGKECALGVDRLVEILESLRDYAKPSSRREGPVDLRRCIDQAMRLLSFEYKHSVEFRVEIADDVVMACGNEGELSQVLINLLVNGIQAMGERGIIFVRVYKETDCIRVEVEDQGPGVPEDIVPRLFDAFFTTKQDERGNGLGLAISSEIARRHGGVLRYEARSGSGAIFVLELPTEQNSERSDSASDISLRSAG